MMKELKKPLGLYEYRLGHHCVWAYFHGELDIVFEGIDHSDCMKWCHRADGAGRY